MGIKSIIYCYNDEQDGMRFDKEDLFKTREQIAQGWKELVGSSEENKKVQHQEWLSTRRESLNKQIKSLTEELGNLK